MSNTPKPDYNGGSLVNLMASILPLLGHAADPRAFRYPPATLFTDKALADTRKLVLLVVDGLGYDYLLRQPESSCLRRHLRGQLDSVFPTTTAASITSLLTGVAPQQHAVTGWFMWLRELNALTTILPFRQRGDNRDLAEAGFNVADLIGAEPLLMHATCAARLLSPAWIVDSAYSLATGGRAERLGYNGLEDFFTKLLRSVEDAASQFVYAYWPEHDALAHDHGVSSAQVEAHFAAFDAAFAGFLAAVQTTDTTVIVTADHGFIDTGPVHYLQLADHPALVDCLARPLCGEPRAAYCYVKAGRHAEFERRVVEELEPYCDLQHSQDLVTAGYFGLGEPHPELAARIGDYTLLMKEQFVIKDYVEGEKPFFFAGVHSGLSLAELRVPLVVAQL